MKKIKLVAGLLTGFLLFTAVPMNTEASTLDDIKEQQQTKKNEMADLDYKIDRTLSEVNKKNEELTTMQEKINHLKIEIEQTGKEITKQKKIVERRVEQAKDRLKTMQTSEVNQSTIQALIESDNLTDFFNRAYVLVSLQSAGNEQVDAAKEEADKLASMEEKQKSDKAELENETQIAVDEKSNLDQQVASLQNTMNKNKALLDELDKQKAKEETRLAEAKAAKEKAAKEKAVETKAAETKAAQEKTIAQNKNNKKEAVKEEKETKQTSAAAKEEVNKKSTAKAAEPEAKEVKEKAAEPKQESTSGKTMVVSATGYSTNEPGLSTHTATGIDLRQNPRVIAVDPRVIPLGSRIEVPGYGVAVAGDTGGAIKGNRIDVHFSSVQQANNWGRKTVTIKVLN